MLNPLDAPDAVSVAAEELEDLLADCNHMPAISLFPVVPVAPVISGAGTTRGHDRMTALAQAVYDAGASGHQLRTPVDPFEPPQAWRDILRRQVTDGFMQPTHRYADPSLRTPAQIRRAGELAHGVADLIEAHLGPVRHSGDVGGPHTGDIGWRNLLLVTSDWATILHLGICD
ncbi:hypothetical protein [Streptomyces sp. NPDC056361]|uniref:hypothetical protein n=1 Tax=Streptomyces sp. NPDC056361 TaxID=3345795 RepID=UPI0035E2434F